MLRALILTLNDDAGRDMGDSDGRFGFVDMLAACARGTIGIYSEIGRIDFKFDVLDFWKNGHRTSRSMDPTLGFGFRYALNPMGAGFEFQLRVDILTTDAHDDFLVAALFAIAFAHDFGLPSLLFGIAQIHAIKVPCKEGGLGPPRSGPNLKEDIPLIVGIFGQKKHLESLLKLGFLELRRFHLVFGHGADFTILILHQGLGKGDGVECRQII